MWLYSFAIFFSTLWAFVYCQDRRPTISYITQPEIVTDIGGTIEAKCSVQYSQVRTNAIIQVPNGPLIRSLFFLGLPSDLDETRSR